MDREQLVKLIADTVRQPATLVPGTNQVLAATAPLALAEAERIVELLDSRGLLALGEPRLWTVVHDDPEAARRYEFTDVAAHSAAAACLIGTRRAILDDPRGTTSNDMTREGREMLADDETFVGHCAMWTIAAEQVPGAVPQDVHGALT